jgi:hypothetical protein
MQVVSEFVKIRPLSGPLWQRMTSDECFSSSGKDFVGQNLAKRPTHKRTAFVRAQ